jgi:hypothetical protein
MPSEKPISLSVATVLTVGGMLVGGGISWGAKADKGEVDTIRKEMGEMREKAREESVIQRNILNLMERMDKRMERIEDKQDYMIREQYKRWSGDTQPPASTPSPNPLHREGQ